MSPACDSVTEEVLFALPESGASDAAAFPDARADFGPDAGSDCAEPDLERALAVRMPFDDTEGSSADIEGGRSFVRGRLRGGFVWRPASGRIDGALELDGTGAVGLGNGDRYIENQGAFTISSWVQLTETSTFTGLHMGNPVGWDWLGNDIRVRVSNEANFLRSSAPELRSMGTWVLVTIVHDDIDQTTELYVNDRLAGSRSADRVIRLNPSNGAMGEGLVGLIDDARFYERALCPVEVAALFNQ